MNIFIIWYNVYSKATYLESNRDYREILKK